MVVRSFLIPDRYGRMTGKIKQRRARFVVHDTVPMTWRYGHTQAYAAGASLQAELHAIKGAMKAAKPGVCERPRMGRRGLRIT